MMPIIFSGTIIQLFAAVTVLTILAGVAIYVSNVLRANSLKKESERTDHLKYFHDLASEGKLSVAEFRRIKGQLADQSTDDPKAGRKESEKDPWILLAGRDVRSDNREETGRWGGDKENANETVLGR